MTCQGQDRPVDPGDREVFHDYTLYEEVDEKRVQSTLNNGLDPAASLESVQRVVEFGFARGPRSRKITPSEIY